MGHAVTAGIAVSAEAKEQVALYGSALVVFEAGLVHVHHALIGAGFAVEDALLVNI